MKTILIYLLQMALCSGLLYGYYVLFLKNKKQHQFNRLYLLSSFLLSLIVPFIKIPFYISLNTDSSVGLQALVKYNELMLPEVVVSSTNKGVPFWSQLLLVVYAAIAVWLILKISYGIVKLVRQRFAQKTQRWNNILIIETSDKGAPYSFFNWLYWNPELDANSANGKKIMQHEYYHIQQLHSIDILLAELSTALAWINPFFWLIKNELKAVHEFSADAYASRNSDELEYATLLVSEAINQKRKILVNPFFSDQLKRRIQMLTTNSKQNPLMKWMALPLILAVACTFIISCRKNDSKASDEIYSKVQVDAKFSGDWIRFLSTNIRGEVPVDNGAMPGNYQVITQFVVDVNGNVSDIKILKDPGFGTAQEAIRVIKLSGKWQPAMMNGKPVKAYRKQPITFQVTEG